MVHRRDFIAGSGAAFGTALLCPEAVLEAEELGRARTVSVFHTTDLHGHIEPTRTYEGLDDVGGLARCMSCIREWRRMSPYSLTVDVGDLVQGTAVSAWSDGQLMMKLLNRIGYDAWTLGNHDFDWGLESLENILQLSQPPVLTANLDRSSLPVGSLEGAWKNVSPWAIREVGGFRIGLIGLITPGLQSWLPPEVLGGVLPTDPVGAISSALQELKNEKPDAIVVMGHMGWRYEDDYANPVRAVLKDANDVDVYLAGHSHQNRPAWMSEGTLCSQASYYGIHCGRVDLTFDLSTRKLVDRRVFTLLMDDRFELDPLVMQMARPDLAASSAELARRVAKNKRPLSGVGRNSALGQLLCESFATVLAKQGHVVDGVFHGTFLSGTLEAGDITVSDCWKIIPYENLLVTAHLTVQELLGILSEDSNDKRSDRTLWPFEVKRNDQQQPVAIYLKGEPLAADRRFVIAFNSYDSQSGGKKLPFLHRVLNQPDSQRLVTDIDTRTALIQALLERGEIG